MTCRLSQPVDQFGLRDGRFTPIIICRCNFYDFSSFRDAIGLFALLVSQDAVNLENTVSAAM